ncbi:hypothetical protein A0J61_03394 [Choanephora cucurbitarum]|uniref:Uncharacterized protein n=1 Tax=Choanephora cucurbitarum TaxID=101091 RepID=A0A1C7NHQ5_9FUNG|nr:hypothetical protein A0J61_03394 [Choanephora cucurbitarum]
MTAPVNGGGFIPEPTDRLISPRQEQKEERKAEKLDEEYVKVTRKFRKRIEALGGYESMTELWKDFGPVVLQTIHLHAPIQRLLNYTNDFHEFCEAFQHETTTEEYQRYYDAMDFAWSRVLDEKNPSETDKIRVVNVLSDGQEVAMKLGLSQVYTQAIEKADDDI